MFGVDMKRFLLQNPTVASFDERFSNTFQVLEILAYYLHSKCSAYSAVIVDDINK